MSWRYYDLFISHAWTYDERYQGIVRLLNGYPRFYWRDYSVPRDRPLVDPRTPVGKRRLIALLDEQIRQASCFVISASMSIYHREWVMKELNIAYSYEKPVIAVRSLGQERVPVIFEDADAVVGWRAESLVTTIRRLCR